MDAFEKASGRIVLYKITARRQGDIEVCYADPTKAKVELGWIAEREIEEMCEDSLEVAINNPNGYMKSNQLIGTIVHKSIVHTVINYIFLIYRIEGTRHMDISEHLSQEKFQEILISVYRKGEEKENLRTIDLINDIKQQLISVMKIAK